MLTIGEWMVGWLHDDVIKWKHSPRYWPFVRGIHRSPVNSLHKGQGCGVLMFSLICAWINGWVNNRDAGDLRRHRAYYDVIVLWFEREFVWVRKRTRMRVNISERANEWSEWMLFSALKGFVAHKTDRCCSIRNSFAFYWATSLRRSRFNISFGIFSRFSRDGPSLECDRSSYRVFLWVADVHACSWG